MSDSTKGEKGELTGPYSTLSVVERTKVLKLSPVPSPVERRKPPLPSSPKPSVSPRISQHCPQPATKPRSKIPPPVAPYRESRKSQSSSSPNILSPCATSPPSQPSPEVFKPQNSSSQSVSSPPQVAISSYEEPVIRNINQRPPMPEPAEPATNVDMPAGIYCEVGTNPIVVGMPNSATQDNEYSVAQHGRTDPSIAPPLPTGEASYDSLYRNENAKCVPVAYEGVGSSSSSLTTSAVNNKAGTTVTVMDHASKDTTAKKPLVPDGKPKLKPPLPTSKPVPYAKPHEKETVTSGSATPPKPKRTYTTNSKQLGSSTPPQSLDSGGDDKRSKPMPLPRVKSDEVVDDNNQEMKPPSQDDELSKVNPVLGPYSYVDIDIPDSPREVVSAEQRDSSATVNTTKPSVVALSPKRQVAPPPPPSSNAHKSKRRTPPPPPPPKPKQAQPTSQPDSNLTKPSNSNTKSESKPNMPAGRTSPLPNPTPAKPVLRKWLPQLLTKKPGIRSSAPKDKNVLPAVAKDAGSTPPSVKRKGSRRGFFSGPRRQSSSEETHSSRPVTNEKSTQNAVVEDRPDSPEIFGYATVGIKKDEQKPAVVNFKGVAADMTPHSKQRVLAAYAEVDLSQKVLRIRERPLSSSHSEEFLDKIFPQSPSSDDRDSFVISPYGTLPRQRNKGSSSRGALPIYAEVQKPNKGQAPSKARSLSESSDQLLQMHVYEAVQGAQGSASKRDVSARVVTSSEGDERLSTSGDAKAEVTCMSSTSFQMPQVPPQTVDSLTLSPAAPLLTAYATVEAKDVTINTSQATKGKIPLSMSKNVAKTEPASKLTKEEIALKTKSLGRSLKPKTKPAPLPPISKKPVSRIKSVELSPSGTDFEMASSKEKLPFQSVENSDKFKIEPFYESVDNLDLSVASKPVLPLEESSSEGATPNSSEFLFKNREFIQVGKRPVENKSSLLSIATEDSDDSTDWDSGASDEEEEEEEEQPGRDRGKIYHIAKELLTTERTFVKGLTLLDKDFRQAVLSANRAHDKPVLAEETLNAILSNVGSLYILNSGLLTQLEERLSKWDSNPKIGDVLMNTAPFFKLYGEYISNFDKALKLLDESCKKNRAFGELVREFESQPACANLPLSGYLLETVQRIPRYKLLLQDYLKHLPEDSDDRLSSERSLELISKVAAHVNESFREVDNFKKLIEVQKKLVGDPGDGLISPSRKLLREGELLKYSRKDIQPRMFFLFTDILIYASAIPPANTTYKVIKRIPLHGMKVIDLDDPEVKHGLQIISTSKSFRLGTNTVEEKNRWMKALNDALFEHEAMLQSRERYRAMSVSPGQLLDNDSESLGSLAPPWLPDNCVSMCMMCSVRFNLTKRRHHCRACGNIFCTVCSSYLAALKYQDNKMDRVCQTCYDKLTGKGKNNPGKKLRMSHPHTKKSVSKLRSAVLEVKARERDCEISGYLQMKDRRWRKQWLEVAEFALYVFEKHEDVSAKRSISLPGYLVIYPLPESNDKSQFCLTHPGTGSVFFKAESEEAAMRWVEVFQNAVKLKSTT